MEAICKELKSSPLYALLLFYFKSENKKSYSSRAEPSTHKQLNSANGRARAHIRFFLGESSSSTESELVMSSLKI